MWTGAVTVENNMEVPQKILKNSTSIWPNNQLCRYTAKHFELWILKRYLHPHVDNTNNNSKVVEIVRMSVNQWMVKENLAVIYIKIFFSL